MNIFLKANMRDIAEKEHAYFSQKHHADVAVTQAKRQCKLLMGKPHFDLFIDDKNINSEDFFKDIEDIDILTPRNPEKRGAQLSIRLKNFDKKIYSTLIESGYICDHRPPDILRIAPAPLYNSFEDIFNFSHFLKSLIND